MKHHYIPEFYLKRWAGPNGRLCEFRRHDRVGLVRRWTAPGGTGYEPDLYALPGLPPRLSQQVENVFMARSDQSASDALNLMYRGRGRSWSVSERSGWSRFLTSLLLRNPEELAIFKRRFVETWTSTTADLETQYQEAWIPGTPTSFAEWLAAVDPNVIEQHSMQVLINIIDSPLLGAQMNDLSWAVRDTRDAAYEFLTSDRPVVRTNGLALPGGHFALPVGPRKLFVAAPDRRTLNRLAEARSDVIVAQVNEQVVAHAVKYVYATDERQRRFIQRRMSSRQAPSIVEAIVREASMVGP